MRSDVTEVELACIELATSASYGRRPALRELISRGWEPTYAEFFGSEFVESLDSAETSDKHHSEAIEWHFMARLAMLKGEPLPGGHDAYFPIWGRGNMKSSIAETIVVMDAILSYAYSAQGYCLYIGREKDRVQENISNLDILLSGERVRYYCPELAEVAINQETNQKKKWTGTFLQTKAGYNIKGATVDSAQAGSRIKTGATGRDVRITLFVPDDIDSRDDSPVISETRFRKLTTEILPMGQENTLTFFAQNLISRYSVMYRIQKGRSNVLTNRKPTSPVPAVRDLVIEQRTVEGIVKDVAVSGRCTWRVWDLDRVNAEIGKMGLEAFLTECQHEVEQSKEGLIVQTYDDKVHAISESEFASVYGSPDAWKDWYKVVFNDWARTKTKYHANVAGYMTVSSQNTQLPGMTFIIPMSFAPDTEPEDVAERLLTTLTPYAYGEVTWKELIADAWQRIDPAQHFNTVLERVAYVKSFYKAIIPRYAQKVLTAFKVKAGVMSHSEDTVMAMYNDGFGFGFHPANPRKTEGIERIKDAFKVDYTRQHSFRNMKGYTRTLVICPDDLSADPVNGVYPPVPYKDELRPDHLHDADLFRYQMKNWRWRSPKLTETGETIDEPLKLNDDFGNGLQMVYMKGLLSNIPLTPQEKFEEEMTAKGLNKQAIIENEDLGKLQLRMIEEGRKAQEKRGHSRYRRVAAPSIRSRRR